MLAIPAENLSPVIVQRQLEDHFSDPLVLLILNGIAVAKADVTQLKAIIISLEVKIFKLSYEVLQTSGKLKDIFKLNT